MAAAPTTIWFSSKSADAPVGRGVRESGMPYEHAFLGAHKNWRQTLSNFAMGEFTWRGARWPSIEHAIQGAKMTAGGEREAAAAFMVGGRFATAEAARAAGRKLVWTEEEMYAAAASAAAAKYAVWEFNEGDILLATAPAELWHIKARCATGKRFIWLEQLRDAELLRRAAI
jgi:predicted NAD-dependent protein-ADP-ribosyltransferase YbiA (DUF1768 family)